MFNALSCIKHLLNISDGMSLVSRTMLFVFFSLNFLMVLCQELPKLNPLSLPVDLKVESRAKILCVASSGDQPIDFEWLKDGVVVNFGKIEQLDESTSSLTLQPLKLDDIGNYTCKASNSIGSDYVTAPLFITAPPWWIIEPVDLKIRKGSNAMIQCKADGSPKVKVTWTKQSESHQTAVFMNLPSNIHVFENGTLSISNARGSDNGVYICIASNGIGADLQKEVHLMVYEYPVVERIVDHVVVERGEKVHISCLAKGDPPLSFTWKKGTKYLNEWYSNSDRISFLELPTTENVQFTISIENTDLEDEGLYTCIARNEFGSDQKDVRLLLVERPAAVQSVDLIDIWSRSVRIRWSTPDNGNSAILSYTVEYWTTPGGHWNTTVPSSASSCILRDLKPFHQYTFHIWASNSIGNGEPSEEIQFTTAKEEPSSPPVDVKIEDIGSTYVRLSWKSPPRETWNGDLTGYYIGYKQSSSSLPFTFNTVEADETHSYDYILRGLRRSTRYVISVRAFNEVGSGPPSEETSFKTHNLEPVPRPSLLVQDIGSTYIQIKWVSDDTVKLSTTAYVIHYRKSGNKWSEILVPTAEQDIYTLTNLDSGAPYQVYVTSHGETGISEPSEIATVRTSPEAIFHMPPPTSAHAQPPVDDATQILYIIVPVAVATVIIVIVIVSACVYVYSKRPLPALSQTYGDLPVTKNFSYMATAPRQRDIPITISGGNVINYGSPYSTVPLTRPEEEEPIYESVVGDTLHRIKQRCFDDDFKGATIV
ncbi:cell adhesion molecule Dscam1 [Parasteatoda tepidariorum]|uniref:cell adhesion molecule Dscam1 n=1 Tax=Parasteatoda tepidariorum TaxID=114398 RepID=UPI0039BD35E6